MTQQRATVTQRTQVGLESVPGTLVPATKRLPNLKLMPYPQFATSQFAGQGFKYPSAVVLGEDWTAFTYDGAASYGELAYVLSSIFSATVPTTVGTAGKQWNFRHSPSNPDVPSTFSMEHGDSNFGERFPYGLFDSMTIAISRKEFKISGTGFGQQWTKGIALTTASSVQTISGTASGPFTLTFQGATTPSEIVASTAVEIQAALQALPTIGAGNVTCTGGPLPTGVVCTFTGELAGLALPAITASDAGVTVAQTTPGEPSIVENVPIDPGDVSVFLDSSFGAIGTTQLLADYALTLALTGRWGPSWPINGSLPSHGGHVELVPKASLKLEIQADTVSDAFVDQVRAGATKYLQVNCVGPAIDTVSYGFVLNVPFAVDKANPLKDLAGVYVADWDLVPIADPVANYALNAVLTNKTAAL